MGHPRSIWKHKKYRSRTYYGSYRYDRKRNKRRSREREFVLIGLTRTGVPHRIVFESHEAAKQAGWEKVA